MYKFLQVALFLALASAPVIAQEGDLKPLAGAHNLEIQLNPFSTNPMQLSNGNLISGLKYRYFTTPNLAYRLLTNISYSRSSEITDNEDDGRPELKETNSRFAFAIQPGIEKHFAGTKYLSPYIGGVGSLAIGTDRLVRENVSSGNTVVETKTRNLNSGFSFGLGAVAGLDIYLIKNMYIGTEFGYGFSIFSPFATEITPPSGDTITDKEDQTSTLTLGPSVQGAIRFGFIF